MNRPTGVALLDQRSELREVSSIFVCHRLDSVTPPLPHPLPPTPVSKTIQPTDTRTVLLQPRIYRKSKASPDKRPDGESLLALSAGCRMQETLGTARVRLGIHFDQILSIHSWRWNLGPSFWKSHLHLLCSIIQKYPSPGSVVLVRLNCCPLCTQQRSER